jgi:hypothetical protein
MSAESERGNFGRSERGGFFGIGRAQRKGRAALEMRSLFAMKQILGSTIATLLAGSALHWNVPAQSPANAPANDSKGSHQTTPGNFADGEVPDGIFRHLGATLIITKGHAEDVKRELKIAGGITVEPNGTVTFKDGRKVRLKGNQMTTFDGQVKDVSPSLTLPASPAVQGSH